MKNFKIADKKRFKISILCIALVLLVAVGGTLAFLSTRTSSVENTFTPSKVSSEVKETLENGAKKDIKIKNTGDTSAYIRVAVLANWVDGSGNIVAGPDLNWPAVGNNWVKSGDYYYYTEAVNPGNTTPDALFAAAITESLAKSAKPAGSNLQVTILADAVQSKGVDGNDSKAAVIKAWGLDPSSL